MSIIVIIFSVIGVISACGYMSFVCVKSKIFKKNEIENLDNNSSSNFLSFNNNSSSSDYSLV